MLGRNERFNSWVNEHLNSKIRRLANAASHRSQALGLMLNEFRQEAHYQAHLARVPAAKHLGSRIRIMSLGQLARTSPACQSALQTSHADEFDVTQGISIRRKRRVQKKSFLRSSSSVRACR